MILKEKKYSSIYIKIDDQMREIKGEIELDYNQIGDTLTFIKSTHQKTGGYTYSNVEKIIAKPKQDGTYLIDWDGGKIYRIKELAVSRIWNTFIIASILLILVFIISAIIADNKTVEDIFTVILVTIFGIGIVTKLLNAVGINISIFFNNKKWYSNFK